MQLTVIIPTFSPDETRLRRTLAGLENQTLNHNGWELIIVDNASPVPVSLEDLSASFSGNLRLVKESSLGLSHARLRGISEATTDLLVFSDDDNVFAPDYLEIACEKMRQNPRVGVAGGKSLPEYEISPPEWFEDGMAPLGCRDLGDEDLILTKEEHEAQRDYPEFSPIGAGMVFRKEAICSWMDTVSSGDVPDRKGDSLSSAGDCDMVLHALDAGWGVAYWPSLSLLHLLPGFRLERDYLAAISRTAYRDYIRVLDRHGIRPWEAIDPWTLPLRKTRLWFRNRPWTGPSAFVRWNSALGNLEGRAALNS